MLLVDPTGVNWAVGQLPRSLKSTGWRRSFSAAGIDPLQSFEGANYTALNPDQHGKCRRRLAFVRMRS